MKKQIEYLLVLGFIISLASCKMELDPYNEQNDWISFVFDKEKDSVERYTFAYLPENVKTDTLLIEVTAIGHLSDRERKVTVEQRMVDKVENAEPGVHFVPFGELAALYKIPAHATGVKLPIVLKRAPSLREKQYILEIRLTENSDFLLGTLKGSVKRIVVSDILAKPNTWGYNADYYMGKYGTEKHKVMIAAAAPYGVTINDEWVESVLNKGDSGYVSYWRGIFMTKLQEINDQRAAQGEGPLTEGPDYGRVIVSFE